MSEADDTTRLETFSDGIFAIAITLLVLEIHVPPELRSGMLGRALLHLWPSYLAFATSFATIGVMWINHHRLFTLIGRTDQPLLGLNLLLLIGISFLPFPTAVVADHIASPDARTAAIFFNGVFFVIAIAFNLLWRYASRRLLREDVDHAWVHGITVQYAFGPLYYLVAVIIAIFSPVGSVVWNLLLAIFFALPARQFHRDQ